MMVSEILQNYKFEMLNYALELNEYKKDNKHVPIEAYDQLLEMYLNLIDSYIESEKSNERFKDSLSDVLGMKKLNTK
jgi:hypothetical protein